ITLFLVFFFNSQLPPEIYTLSLHDALPILWARLDGGYIPLYFSDVTTSDFAYEEHRALLKFRRKEGVTPDGALEDHALIDVIKRSEEHTSELQSRENLVCRLLLEKKKQQKK